MTAAFTATTLTHRAHTHTRVVSAGQPVAAMPTCTNGLYAGHDQTTENNQQQRVVI